LRRGAGWQRVENGNLRRKRRIARNKIDARPRVLRCGFLTAAPIYRSNHIVLERAGVLWHKAKVSVTHKKPHHPSLVMWWHGGRPDAFF